MISNRFLLSASTNLFRRVPVLCQRTQAHADCQGCVDLLHLFLVDLPDIASQPPTVNRPYLLQQQQGGRGKARHILQQNMGRKVGLIPSAGDGRRYHGRAEIVSHIILENEDRARSALFRSNHRVQVGIEQSAAPGAARFLQTAVSRSYRQDDSKTNERK